MREERRVYGDGEAERREGKETEEKEREDRMDVRDDIRRG